MTPSISDEMHDAMQLRVAWTGAGRCSLERLGWWDTDLMGDAGGGDSFARARRTCEDGRSRAVSCSGLASRNSKTQCRFSTRTPV
jgi:hypothetical protein